MSHNTFGHLFRVTTWGESHGTAIGCVVDGCPPRLALSEADIQPWLDRRRPGQSKFVTQRQEPDAVRILGRGTDLKLEVATCRRIELTSCSIDDKGERPPSVLELVKAKGDALGPTVILAVGYNDFEDAYAASIESALDALERAGVTRVLWPTLRAARHPHLTMNEAIRSAAERHPRV